jgi:hypothetical protein
MLCIFVLFFVKFCFSLEVISTNHEYTSMWTLIPSIVVWLWDKAVESYNIWHLRFLWQSCQRLKSSMVQRCATGPSHTVPHLRKLESASYKKYGVLNLISELWKNFFDCLLLLSAIPNVSPCFIFKVINFTYYYYTSTLCMIRLLCALFLL